MLPDRLRVQLRGHSLTASQVISVDTARIARGCCAAGGLIFDKGMVSNQNDRLSISRKPPEILFN